MNIEKRALTRVIIASHAQPQYFERMKEILEDLSSPNAAVRTEDWYQMIGITPNTLNCNGFAIVSDQAINLLGEDEINILVGAMLERLLKNKNIDQEQRIMILHPSEIELIHTLCDAFAVNETELAEVEESGFFCFSLDADYYASRFRGRINTREPVMPEILGHKNLKKVTHKQVKTVWPAIIVERDAELADNMATLLVTKAYRQNLSISVIPYSNVADALRGIAARKPYVVSINPGLPLGRNGKVETWGGLEILPIASEHNIPTILRSDEGERQIKGAMNQRRIQTRPTKIVKASIMTEWAETMIAQLMTKP